MIGFFLIIQVPNAGYEWVMPVLFCPVDSLFLRLKRSESVVGVVFHDIVVDSASLGTTFRPRFYLNICHPISPRQPILHHF